MCLELERNVLALVLQRVKRSIYWFRITRIAVCDQGQEDL